MEFFIADKKICFVLKINYAVEHIICCNYSGFLPGIFSGGGKIYCYANFSIVFGPNFKEGGGGKSLRVGKLPRGASPCGRKPVTK